MHKIKDEILSRIDITEEENEELHLDRVDLIFNELEALENDLDKYNMDWVFNYAHDKITDVFRDEIKDKFLALRKESEAASIELEANSLIKKVACSIDKNARAFNGAQTVTIVGEIIGSFAIIMLSHELTSFFVTQYAGLISATIIVAFFAIFKIFIEKRFVSRMNKKRQKRIYKKSLKDTRKAFIQMFIFYIKVSRFNRKHRNDPHEDRHKLARLFIKENHPKLENI